MNTLRPYLQGAFALRGLAALIFGVLVLWQPGISIAALVLLFGAYAIVSGVMACIAAWASPVHKGLLLISGLFGIVVGLLTLTHPVVTLLAVVYIVAFLILIEGAVSLTIAIAEGGVGGFNWVLALSGAINILFSILLLASPSAGVVTLVYVLGFYAVFNGIALEVHAWQMHEAAGEAAPAHRPAHA